MTVKLIDPIETKRAIGVKVKNNGIEKILWFPRSLISRFNNYALFEAGTHDVIEIPDWLYNQKFNEVFNNEW